ncbi:PAS domain S-box protein [Maridesulfovibrio sp.]|uniref:PAS domain S-box protein n=1 Tax=Maridesulfovibrio sp. TaxID=2795000 RepID=UPI003BA9CE26
MRIASYKYAGFILLFLLICYASSTFAAEAENNRPTDIQTSYPDFKLTAEEQKWLEDHPQIEIGVMNAWPPMEYVDESGKPQGIGVEFIHAVNKRIGGRLQIKPGSWNDIFLGVKNKQMAALVGITPRPDREPFFNFTSSYIKVPHAIITRINEASAEQLSDLNGKRVAVEENFYLGNLLKQDYPQIKVALYPNTSDALHAVSSGAADAYVGNRAVALYLIKNELITNLHIQGKIKGFVSYNAMGVRKDWPILHKILQKALDTISPAERDAIFGQWVKPEGDTVLKKKLTSAERIWLEKHPVIRLGTDGQYPPFEFFNDSGKLSGVGADYLEIISQRLGVEFEVVPDLSWNEVLEGVKNDVVDMIPVIDNKPERRSFLNFTKPYVRYQNAIVTLKSNNKIQGVEDLKGKKLALPKGYSSVQWIENKYPSTKLILKGSPYECLEAVVLGEADATVANMAVMHYLIQKYSFFNLKFAALTSMGSGGTSMGIRKDWPEFATILQKALDSIDQAEHREISVKWAGFKKDEALVSLSEKEKAWLAKQPTIKVAGDIGWPPFNFSKDGKLRGFSIDYMNLLAKKTGAKIEYVTGPSWNDFLEMMKDGTLDVMLDVVKTPERMEYLSFTPSYAKNPNTIISRKDTPYHSLEELFGKTVAIPKGFFYEEILKRDYPDIKIKTVQDTLGSMTEVSYGKADAAFGELAVFSYYIESNMMTNLAVSGDVKFGNPEYSRVNIATRKDQPELNSILTKGMKSITEAEKSELRKKWLRSAALAVQNQSANINANDSYGFEELHFTVDEIIYIALGILALVLLLIFGLFKLSRSEKINRLFGTRKFRIVVYIGLLFFTVVVLLLGTVSMKRVKNIYDKSMQNSMATVALMIDDRLDNWLMAWKKNFELFGKTPRLAELTQELLQVEVEKDKLLQSKALADIRTFFAEYRQKQPNIGFFIINRDHISIGSMRDSNIGSTNLIWQKYPHLVDAAFKGEVSIVPPLTSDVMLNSSGESLPATMFVIGPVRNRAGGVLAVMTVRIDMRNDLSKIANIKRITKTEEAYLFDNIGRMLTRSLFEKQLLNIGLLQQGQTSELAIRLLNPGVNLLEGGSQTMERSELPLTKLAAAAINKSKELSQTNEVRLNSGIVWVDGTYRDYRGVPVVGCWAWRSDMNMGIAVEMDEADFYAQYYDIRLVVWVVLGLTQILFIAAVLFVLMVGEKTSRSLTKAKDELEQRVQERTQELERTMSIVRAMSDASLDAMIMIDSRGKVQFWNSAAAVMFDLSAEEAVGKQMHEIFVPEEARGKALLGLEKFRETGQGPVIGGIMEETAIREDGSSFPVEIAISSFKHEDEWFAVGSLRDISERKKQEEALLHAEEMNRNILQSVGEGIFGVDSEGCILFINQAALNMLGYEPNEVFGQPIHDLIHHHHADGSEYGVEDCPMHRAFTEARRFKIDNEVLWRKDGSSFPVEYTAAPIERENEVDGAVVVFHDISERREAEWALKKLSSVVEQSPVTVVITDKNGIIEYVNPMFSEVTGYTAEEAVGISTNVMKSGQHSDDFYKELWETINSKNTWHGEFINKKKNGDLFWESAVISPILGNKDEIEFYVAIKQDITDQKAMEEELLKSKEQLQYILDTSPVGVAFSTKGVIHFANPRFREMYGVSIGDESPDLYVNTSDRDNIVREMKEHGIVSNWEIKMYNAEGEERDILITYLPITYDGEEGILGWLLDITDRNKAFQEIERSQKQLSALFDALPVGVTMIAQSGKIITANSISNEILGVTADEHTERKVSDDKWEIIHPDGTLMNVEEFPASRCLEENRVIKSVEMGVNRPQGDTVWISTSAAPVDEEVGGGVAVAFEDITIRKEMETQLVAALDEAEEATRAKSDFLANMSHEIRTPMNAILGMGHLALKTELTSKQRDYLEKIDMAAKALLRIINDILDFSKIEAGKLDIEHVDFSLEDILDNLSNLISVKAQEKGVELFFRVDQDVPLNLIGDPLRLGQILINLCGNAVKFTSEGEIVVNIGVEEQRDKDIRLRFEVSDTGVGMTEEQKSKLFTAFSQADTSTTRKFGGTGLGLTISKRLVEMMDGEIGADSEYGKGSTFWFNAKLAINEEKGRKKFLIKEDFVGLNVLVVDDNITSQNILREMLEDFEFKVTVASGGPEALDILETAEPPFKLVLMDWKMPEMDGIETSRRIKDNSVLKDVPTIIMVTAYGREEVINQAQEVGLDGFLVKPVGQSVLFNTIMEVFGQQVERSGLRDIGSDEFSHTMLHTRGAQILLAEDNEINQQVACELLEGVGLVVDIAENGRVAVEKAHAQSYDLVLMDIQMPEMDGLEATALLRADKKFDDLPIVAMTAHAMAGDREKSLAHGMNDHITKPIDPSELYEVLSRLIPDGERELAPEKPESVQEEVELPDEIPGIDIQSGLMRVNNNRKLYRELLVKVHDNYAQSGNEVESLIANEHPDDAQILAHTIKGLAGNIGAGELQEAAAVVEGALKSGDPAGAEDLARFKSTLGTLIEALAPIAAEDAQKQEEEIGGETVDYATLLDASARLQEQVKARKPKLCAPIIEEMNGYEWPENLGEEILTLGKLVKRYKFKDAAAIIENIQSTLGDGNE